MNEKNPKALEAPSAKKKLRESRRRFLFLYGPRTGILAVMTEEMRKGIFEKGCRKTEPLPTLENADRRVEEHRSDVRAHVLYHRMLKRGY